MLHKGTAFALTATLLVFGTISAPTQATSHTSAQGIPWLPEPYASGGNPPPNFKGLDVKQVWSFLKSKQKILQKGKYETTAEYKQRLAASASNIAPLISTSEYAFLLQDVKPTYDADTQEFTAWKFIWCRETMDYGPNKGWFTCVISQISRQESQYIGSNAFGVNATIDKIIGKDFGIAVPEDTKFFNSEIFSQSPSSPQTSIHELKASFAVPINEARELNNQTIGVLLVGKFDSVQLIDGYPIQLSPTIDSPYDEFVTQDAVPFTPTKLVLYVEETGQVLGIKEL